MARPEEEIPSEEVVRRGITPLDITHRWVSDFIISAVDIVEEISDKSRRLAHDANAINDLSGKLSAELRKLHFKLRRYPYYFVRLQKKLSEVYG